MFKWLKRQGGTVDIEVAAAAFVEHALDKSPDRSHMIQHVFTNASIDGIKLGSWKITVEPLKESDQ